MQTSENVPNISFKKVLRGLFLNEKFTTRLKSQVKKIFVQNSEIVKNVSRIYWSGRTPHFYKNRLETPKLNLKMAFCNPKNLNGLEQKTIFHETTKDQEFGKSTMEDMINDEVEKPVKL